MPEILYDFPIQAPPERVFDALVTPAGLDAWWTLESDGIAGMGQRYRFFFGGSYVWAGMVRRYERARVVEWELTEADADWTGTRLSFMLEADGAGTVVHFQHTGWAEANTHFRITGYCWAMYLRLLRRFVEHGERVPYAERLNA